MTPVRRAIHQMDQRPDETADEVRQVVFWTLAEFCAEFRLPFDLTDRADPERLSSGSGRGPRPVLTAE